MLRVIFAPHADAKPLKIRLPDEFRTQFGNNEVFDLKFHGELFLLEGGR